MELRWDCENIPRAADDPLPPFPLRPSGRAGSLPPAAVAVAVSGTRGGEPCRLPLRSRWDELLAPATREGGAEETGSVAAAVPLAPLTAASPALAAPLLPALASTLAWTLASDGAAALAAAPSAAAPGRAKRAT